MCDHRRERLGEKKNREKEWLEVAQGQLPPPFGWFFGLGKEQKRTQ